MGTRTWRFVACAPERVSVVCPLMGVRTVGTCASTSATTSRSSGVSPQTCCSRSGKSLFRRKSISSQETSAAQLGIPKETFRPPYFPQHTHAVSSRRHPLVGAPGKFTDYCGFLKAPGTEKEWLIKTFLQNLIGVRDMSSEALGLKPNDQTHSHYIVLLLIAQRVLKAYSGRVVVSLFALCCVGLALFLLGVCGTFGLAGLMNRALTAIRRELSELNAQFYPRGIDFQLIEWRQFALTAGLPNTGYGPQMAGHGPHMTVRQKWKHALLIRALQPEQGW